MPNDSMVRSTALVTGGSKRIGRAICLHLAEMGYSVAVHHNSASDEADALVNLIQSKGGRACSIQADLSDANHASSLISRVGDELGPVSCVVNNASIFQFDDIESFSQESWNHHMDVNARAPMLLIQGLINQLPEGKQATVVNILDQKIAQPNPDYLSYSVSKYALAGLTETLARGLSPRVRVNAVAPGHTLPSSEQTQEGFDRAQIESPLGYGPKPEDIADAVVYLIGARAVTGQILFVDAGERFLARSRDVIFETEDA
ncbi:MAG TPA: SDR family oxidoreductase [Candidatus Thalassarchaeaceae archaeon]|jgi:NAD(P)-dependent dehydrogenase (short-subunit alcohol dehydrogenase family)|nr:MAG TPA: SDR family oxidoreductase [Candidatus Poseidoniales archaeon]HIH79764.1 SDR family oxidoreductase [Candidatus Thalassarchaeaceae archaeon]|tara:strand:- start:10 stop:789 length:780 start_codon:yes stop_codon:yes gene_type:complete